jgi:acyl-CoA synthetase (AMP-forming)/AMP-acid ligase II
VNHYPLLRWLDYASEERGIRFARPGNEWEFISYKRLANSARRHASLMRAVGISPGDVVALLHRNSPEFVAAFFGCLMLGGTPAPLAIPSRFRGGPQFLENVQRSLQVGQVRAVSAAAEFAPSIAPAVSDCGADLVVCDLDDGAAEYEAELIPPEIGLLQFSSGSTGPPRGVRVPLTALEANIETIVSWTNGRAEKDAVATWAPLHHDMGLIGCLLAPVSRGVDVWLMEPEHFIRSPLRWLRCFGESGATVTAVPAFALGHVIRRVRPDMLRGLDFTGWQALVVGAERIDASTIGEFSDLLDPFGFSRSTLMPAYGLAEATLAVCGSRRDEQPRITTVAASSLIPGQPVRMAADERDQVALVGCGRPLPGVRISILGEDGQALPEGYVGEIEVTSPSVARGYAVRASRHELNGVVRTADAGFLLEGEVFVLGRIGDSVKLQGRWIFAEDLGAVAASVAPRSARHVTLLGSLDGREIAVVLAEGGLAGQGAEVGLAVANHAAGLRVLVCAAPRGSALWTTSGKPKRRATWERLVTRQISAEVIWDSQPGALPACLAGEVATAAPGDLLGIENYCCNNSESCRPEAVDAGGLAARTAWGTAERDSKGIS